ncbi:O-antigen ligase family protein [Cytophaga aurantiaca]|uniref:O-antigen ligase family protein n=1 Tax=Cytophaga aurantiaca TaxID=29530 RepID=UPI000527C3DF|nr:O-antigen ligase family protein [Cytophaga aurantiaca]
MNLSFKNIHSNTSFLNSWFLIAGIIALVGIFFSRAMISIGMIGIVLIFILTKSWEKSFSFRSTDPILFFLAPILFIYVLGGIWTENHSYWLDRIVVKLPLLFLPLGAWAIKDILRQCTIDLLILIFISLCAATALGSFVYYILHFKEVTESYKHAKTIPTIIEHIRFSLLLAVAVFASIQAYFHSNLLTTKKQKNSVAALGLFIFIFLHVLSIRSGLLALYATGFVWLIVYVVQSGKKKFLLVLPAGLGFLVLMYFFVPSLHNKANYMVRDISQFATGKSVNNYSDGNRLLSMKIGTEVGLEHPIIGVGSGDVQDAMSAVYKNEYPDIDKRNWLIPHNQFVYMFTALGSIGLLIFIACLIYPLFNRDILSDIFCLAVLVSSYTSFLSESTLEIQQGIVLVSLMFCLAYLRKVAVH